MFQNDYFMRETENISKALALVFLQKETNSIELLNEQGAVSEGGLLYHRLKKLMKEGKINEAENILIAEFEQVRTSEYLEAGVLFYKDLQELSDQTLHECDFSRQEIFEGLQHIWKLAEEADETKSYKITRHE